MKLDDAGDPHLSADGAGLHRGVADGEDGARQSQQFRTARLERRCSTRYASATTANNGSAFAGLNGNTLWFNTTLGIAMFLGRFAYVVPVSWRWRVRLRPREKIPAFGGARSRRTGRYSSACCVGVIVILYLLQYFPALALGPVIEHFADARRQDILTSKSRFYLTKDNASMAPRSSKRPVQIQRSPAAPLSRRFANSIRAPSMKNPVIFVTEVVSARRHGALGARLARS